ncbi:MAG: DUF2461 domain-containing protein [Flavobacteriales bacterium]|nr:DUF2461 domain-containing protein [Flavobacteriales bacterium]
MKYFDKDFLDFFKDLAANNNRDWFQANKKRYESSVKKPFEVFATDVIKAMQKTEKFPDIKPGNCIFRINRDIRFSKDKTPYKLNASAAVSKGGRKDVETPGMYVELGPEKFAMASGVYQPSKENLERIRKKIAKDPKKFYKLLEAPDFKKLWGELKGERNKILPPEFKKAAETCPYIFNKQFYYWVELAPSNITKDGLVETVMKYWKAGKDVGDYLMS